ncbi:hypothetical protein [Microvirga massiliensis]|uniref:hypothetical protein n=1 Tax=Microvirga massiliensis TaxID=1033741 RepID=UPI00062B602C|nr:hypothetical protein [Microvirga massiliensis]
MTETTPKTARTPAQLAAIRRSYGLRKAAAAKAEARKQKIQQYYKDKARKRHIDEFVAGKKAAWLKNKIQEGYKARARQRREAAAQQSA